MTDKEGKVVFENLEYGNYYYKETKAPEGYTIDNKMYPFEIKDNNQVISKTATDDKIIGKIEITKKDSKDSKKVLANTEFTIFDSNKKEIKKGVTDKEGKVVFENLEYGNYYYKETKAPEGYTIDNKMYPFEIKDNNQVISKTATNDKIVPIKDPIKDPTLEENVTVKPEDSNNKQIEPSNENRAELDNNTKNNKVTENISSEKTDNNKVQTTKDNYGNPITSDSSILPYIGLFAVSTIGLAVNLNNRKKK
ncbi:Cna B domain-containing protein [[Clostridium] sordellii]|nr:Cna B domain-containing protein [[Clostridium] sordellii] [Paeniclostridium sordellii]